MKWELISSFIELFSLFTQSCWGLYEVVFRKIGKMKDSGSWTRHHWVVKKAIRIVNSAGQWFPVWGKPDANRWKRILHSACLSVSPPDIVYSLCWEILFREMVNWLTGQRGVCMCVCFLRQVCAHARAAGRHRLGQTGRAKLETRWERKWEGRQDWRRGFTVGPQNLVLVSETQTQKGKSLRSESRRSLSCVSLLQLMFWGLVFFFVFL